MKAVILAGGKGTRLRPYTTCIPKPLMPIGDLPILEIVLKQLKKHGFDNITITVGHLAHLIQAFFQDGANLGLNIKYSFEDRPLGTAGPLSLFIHELEDDFLVMNGDLLTTLNYRKMYKYHKENGAAATISLYKREVKIDFGVINTEQNMLVNYIEKPTYSFEVSMGVNILNPHIIKEYITPNERLDMPELMLRLKENGERVICFRDDCYWLDIGRIDDYQRAVEIFEEKKEDFL
ncbi:sugar phosphate nucleotidyltransferase [Desulfotomaculum sp. 1211_IL3151]|uniref:sugar phosphate nucleotidyltransferase n=1 Tax=Desulfotomaculum sp. 1211_IL3151 TaxID=3084055 RepID=UPI002FDAA038